MINSNPSILILCWRDIAHPLGGGAEISLFEQAKYWRKKNATVTWFSSSFPGAKREEIIEGIKIIRLGSHFTVHLFAAYYYLSNKLGRVDIVIDAFHFLPFFTPVYMRSPKKIGLLNEVAGDLWFHNINILIALVGFILEKISFYFYHNTTFIVGSNSAKTELEAQRIDRKNIFTIHHGVRVITPSINIKKEKTPVLIFLGRASKDKGIEDVISAYNKIFAIYKNVKLWIVGREERDGYILETIKKKNLSEDAKKNIKFYGYVPQNKKFQLLKKSWILVHPSKKEGWGLNVIEAASQGTPTVGYNVEGLKDSIKNNVTGILVNPNTNDLVKGINRLIVNKFTYKKLSESSIKWSKKFTWEKSGKESWRVINLVCYNKR